MSERTSRRWRDRYELDGCGRSFRPAAGHGPRHAVLWWTRWRGLCWSCSIPAISIPRRNTSTRAGGRAWDHAQLQMVRRCRCMGRRRRRRGAASNRRKLSRWPTKGMTPDQDGSRHASGGGAGVWDSSSPSTVRRHPRSTGVFRREERDDVDVLRARRGDDAPCCSLRARCRSVGRMMGRCRPLREGGQGSTDEVGQALGELGIESIPAQSPSCPRSLWSG